MAIDEKRDQRSLPPLPADARDRARLTVCDLASALPASEQVPAARAVLAALGLTTLDVPHPVSGVPAGPGARQVLPRRRKGPIPTRRGER